MSSRLESLGEGARNKVTQLQRDKVNRKYTHYGRVMQLTDDGTQRIKVLIRGVDKPDEPIDELAYCHPLLPRMFAVQPQVGETVKIMMTDHGNTDVGRLWIGPIISQPEKIKNDPWFHTALAGREGGLMDLGPKLPDDVLKAIYPLPDDVGLLGRDNSDIILRKDEVIIRAGKHVLDQPTQINKKNPAYINISVLRPSDLDDEETTNPTEIKLNLGENRTDTVLMSNKLFLIGRPTNSRIVKPLLEKSDHRTLEEKLHPVVYGDVLYEFMTILRNWISSHKHSGGGVAYTPPSRDNGTVELETWFQNNLGNIGSEQNLLLSKSIFVGGDSPAKNFSEPIADSFNDTNDLSSFA
jgi:hypothetical protein